MPCLVPLGKKSRYSTSTLIPVHAAHFFAAHSFLLTDHDDVAPAVNVVAKGIFATTETHSRVAIICNSMTVNDLCETYAVYLMIDPFLNFQISMDIGFKCWDGPFMHTKAGLWLYHELPLISTQGCLPPVTDYRSYGIPYPLV